MQKQQNEIERISKKLYLKDVEVASIKKDSNNATFKMINNVLAVSKIGYFEWQLENQKVFLTDLVYEYCGFENGMTCSFYKFLQIGLFENTLYNFLVELEKLYTGTLNETVLELEFFSHLLKSEGHLKIVIVRNDDEQIISGTVHDMSDIVLSKNALVKSRRLLKQMIDVLPMPIIYINEKKKLEYINNAVGEVFGVDNNKLIDLEYGEYIAFIEETLKVTSKKEVSSNQNHLVYEISGEKDGNRLEILLDSILIVDENEHVEGRLLVHTDISNQMEDLDKVKKVLEANELVVKIVHMVNQNADMHVLYETILNDIIDIVPKATKGCILRLDYDENLYMESSKGYETGYADNFKIPFKESFAYNFLNNNYRKSVSIDHIQKNYIRLFPDIDSTSRGFKLESNITAPINIDNKLYGLISIDSSDPNGFDEIDLNLVDFLRDKIEVAINRYNELSQVIEQSQLDELTGLINRNHFNKLSESLLNEATLYKQSFSLILIDLDRLKKVNDEYGHLAGDQLLKKFATFVSDHSRPEDVLARIGGDEFVGLVKNIDSDTLKSKITEINTLLLTDPLDYNGNLIEIKFSFGIAEFPLDGRNVTELIELADKRMYQQKMQKYN